MPYTRSLSRQYCKITYNFPDGWEERFKKQFSQTKLTEARVLDCLETQIEIHVEVVRNIIRGTIVKSKPVIEYLGRIELWTNRLVESVKIPNNHTKVKTAINKLCELLATPSYKEDLSKRIALECLDCNLEAKLNPPEKKGGTFIGEDAGHYIKQAQRLETIRMVRKMYQEALSSLKDGHQVGMFSPHLFLEVVSYSRNSIQNLEAFQQGELMPDSQKNKIIMFGDKVFTWEGKKPDPVSVSHARPETDAQREFVKKLVLLYECGWVGGNAYAHRNLTGDDAKPKSPFMRFLDSVKEALPHDLQPKGNAFYGMANEAKKKLP